MHYSETKTLQSFQKFLDLQKDTFNVKDICFPKQVEFITDIDRFKTACCGGRAGKTFADAVYLHEAARSKPNGVALYLTLSRSNAKKLIWPDLVRLNDKYNMGAKVNETDLSIKHKNGTFIYVSGAMHAHEIEKFRGLPLIICIIDEVQSFKAFIRNLIDDVVSKRLFDFGGTLALTGTPGPVPSGYFYDACNNNAYKHYHWTMFDNPWIIAKSGKTHRELLDEELHRKGVTETDPTIQREVFGKWVIDENALVIRYDKDKNHYDKLPDGKWNYCIGVDLGFDDSDAIAVIGWQDHSPAAYLIEEMVAPEQGITELANKLISLVEKYDPVKIVMDTGGLGKKIAESIKERFDVPLVAAEKTRKFEYIEILNDALRTSKFMAKKDSLFSDDSKLLEWDSDSHLLKIKYSFHSDIIDAVLYGFREALHWLYEPVIVKPKLNTKQYYEQEEKNMIEYFENDLKRGKTDDWDGGIA